MLYIIYICILFRHLAIVLERNKKITYTYILHHRPFPFFMHLSFDSLVWRHAWVNGEIYTLFFFKFTHFHSFILYLPIPLPSTPRNHPPVSIIMSPLSLLVDNTFFTIPLLLLPKHSDVVIYLNILV